MPRNYVTPLPSIEAPHRRARLLLVDDLPANLLALEGILAPLGHELVLAPSGEEALRHLLHQDFAAILMDVQMPGLTGLETARLIRSRERTKHIPILFVTALSREAAYVTRGYAEGAVDYLLKPLDPDMLRAKVKVFVELYLRGEQLKAQAVELANRRTAEEEARRAAEFEEQLVGIVGHDLRTPLSVVQLTAARGLQREDLDDRTREQFARIQRGARRMEKIVSTLLDLTHARVGGLIHINRRWADLCQVVHAVVDEFHAIAPARDVRLELPSGPVMGDWDAARLSQVASNLIHNALKYGAPDSAIRVAVTQDSRRTRVTVHNEGEAISEEMLPTLFEPFRRGKRNDAQAHNSFGLGLYIAREIVRAHGGAISVRSSAQAGTTFEVCLPLPDEPRACAPAQSAGRS